MGTKRIRTHQPIIFAQQEKTENSEHCGQQAAAFLGLLALCCSLERDRVLFLYDASSFIERVDRGERSVHYE